MNTLDQLKDNPLLPQAMQQWGLPAQLGMMIEESGELLQAINHMWRGRAGNETVDKALLCEEIADCFIMLSQLRLIDTERVDEYVAAKLDRLNGRLNPPSVLMTLTDMSILDGYGAQMTLSDLHISKTLV